MVVVHGTADVQLQLKFEVNESEARALDALCGYGDDAFVCAFYEKLGKAYMEKHEGGLRSFLKSCRQTLPGILSKVDDARAAIHSLKGKSNA